MTYSQPYSFFAQLKDIAHYFYFAPALLFALVASILYFLNNADEYYEDADYLLKWSLVYIGSATPQQQQISFDDSLSEYILSIYVVVYVAFSLYLYKQFYYRYTFPILFYQKMQQMSNKIKKKRESIVERRASSVNFLESEYPSEGEYVYTLSGIKRKKKSSISSLLKRNKRTIGSVISSARSIDECNYQNDIDQTTKLLDNKLELIIPYTLNDREDSMIMSDNSINLIFSPSASLCLSEDESMSDDEEQKNNKRESLKHQRFSSAAATQNGKVMHSFFKSYTVLKRTKTQSEDFK